MKKNNIILTVCVVVAMTFSLSSQAQRLIPKQRGIEFVGSVPLIKDEKFLAAENFGMGASLTRYLGRENYTFVMAEYEQQNMPYRSYNVKLKDALLHLGYMHPIVSDNGKNVFLYAGISALGGYEELNEDKKLLPDGATLLDRSHFVYGGAVHSSVEVFLTDRILFLV
ncbi:conjugative transposon protein TraO [Prevotella disiens FB035-09AN]|uniref:Conjugative transposon protein TraO n=1 Tax=Prevotella disiens FB035-09AN TaxID=866771 RepID=E1KTB8_9BACT|nr:conjugative transposon protein TraO [Prevotella disiens FB035-09AN]